jgi:hypothetical protein
MLLLAGFAESTHFKGRNQEGLMKKDRHVSVVTFVGIQKVALQLDGFTIDPTFLIAYFIG